MRLTERQRTTNRAVKMIKKSLYEREYFSAVLLSYIYCHIRLRSLMTDYLAPEKGWLKINDFLEDVDLRFSPLVDYCKKYKRLNKGQTAGLKNLNRLRNEIAHETTKWTHLKEEDKRSMEDACRFAMTFMKETSD